MALTESTMMELASSAPEFSLKTADGKSVSKSDFAGQPLLVMFICNHCPYVKHVAPQLAKLGHDYSGQVAMVAIQSNDVEAYPDDGPAKMLEEIELRGYSFPYVLDEDQSVAKAYTAACTPDFFLFDADHKLVYRGQLDTTKPTRIKSGVYDSTENPSTGENLRAAMDAVLSGNAPDPAKQLPSMGCNIKWRSGNEPSYFSA